MVKKIAIVGMGFMGGSLALAVRRFCPEIEITAIDVNPEALHLVRSRNAAHHVTLDLGKGVKGADIVFVATPIHVTTQILRHLGDLISDDTLVTDLGSTKAEICKIAQKVIPSRFVGGHPMTGSELQGMKGSDPYLFENAVYLLTPLKPRDKKVPMLAQLLEQLGASVISISPQLHDEVAAYVSHLPQLLAVALTVLIGEKSVKQPLYKELAAGGFRDMTRIASSPYAMWRDILESNVASVKNALDDLIERLQTLRKLLGKPKIGNVFKRAAGFRGKLPTRRKGFIKPLYRIVVSVKDEPGSLARLTDAVFRAGVNISDIELMKVREGSGGTFQLHFASPEDAENAVTALTTAGWESHTLD